MATTAKATLKLSAAQTAMLKERSGTTSEKNKTFVKLTELKLIKSKNVKGAPGQKQWELTAAGVKHVATLAA
jgi:hypothetical protein